MVLRTDLLPYKWCTDVVGRGGSGVAVRHTLHMQCGCALVHGEHIGAGAHVGACITQLHIANGQDAVEVHGSGGQLPIV